MNGDDRLQSATRVSGEARPDETPAPGTGGASANATTITAARRALALIIAGLLFALYCTLHVTPGRFMLFALIGAPLLAGGMLLFLLRVWRFVREKGAL